MLHGEQIPQDVLDASPEENTKLVGIYEIGGLPKGFYNAAACRLTNGSTLLLGRYVTGEPRWGEPDIGPMAVAIVNGNQIESFKEIWQPEPGDRGDLLEDPRLVLLPDGRVFMGVTRLAKHEGRNLPFPAVAFTDIESLVSGRFPDTIPITDLGTGDQTMPLGSGPNALRVISGKNTVPLNEHIGMFRREADNHSFVVFSVNEAGKASFMQNLVIPEAEIPYWGEERMGLTMPPAWLDRTQREAILLIHGFNRVEGKPRYHIGSSRLIVDQNGDYVIDNISPKPLLSPGDFEGILGSQPDQRRPEERDARYLCGGTTDYDDSGQLQAIEAYPSIGDVWTLGYPINVMAIIRGWRANASQNRRQY